MLSVSEISVVPPGVSGPALDRKDPKGVAIEFDAMVLEMLLRQSGLLRSMGSEAGADASVFGEMYLHDFARQLATQVDLGFGSLLVSQAQHVAEGSSE
ncbi:MAG TPA: hypothetical protein VI565_00405 [Burkholderiales bacterium]|nr:hypothetical protein [Burkholderiales bacterium]